MDAKLASKKQAAKNRNLNYGEKRVIHETSRKRITAIPFYINRSSGEELSVKLLVEKKIIPNTWITVEEQSITLDEEDLINLNNYINEQLSLCTNEGSGDYLVINYNSTEPFDLTGLDSDKVTKAIISVLENEDIISHINTANFSDELITAFRGAIRLKELINAINELEENLINGVTDEQAYQEWCEKHTWVFGNSYVLRDAQREISMHDTIDILLPSAITGYRDIVELKRPDMEVLQYDKAHRDYYFSAEVSKAIGQCHRYMDVLTEEASRGMRDHPEIVAYHPRATIVIGRSEDWSKEKHKSLHGLNSRLSGISVMTYDHLLIQGKRLIEVLTLKE